MKILGLRSLIYPTKDIKADTKWWIKVLGYEPYYTNPNYVGFDAGGYEIGLDPHAKYTDGAITYLGVANLTHAISHFEAQGCHVYTKPQDVGDGISMATVKRKDGQIIGLIYNPVFKAKSS